MMLNMGANPSILGPASVLGPHAAKMTYVDLSKLLFDRFTYGSEHEIGWPMDYTADVVPDCGTMEPGEFVYRLSDSSDSYELVSNSNPRDYSGGYVPSIAKNHRRVVMENCSEYVALVHPVGGGFVFFTVASGSKTEYFLTNEYFVPDIETAAEIKFTLTPLKFKSRHDAITSMRQLVIGMILEEPERCKLNERTDFLEHESRRLADQVGRLTRSVETVRSNNTAVVDKFRERVNEQEARIKSLEQDAVKSQAISDKLQKRLNKVLAKLPVATSDGNCHMKKTTACTFKACTSGLPSTISSKCVAKRVLERGPTLSSEELARKVGDGIDDLANQLRSTKLEKQRLETRIRSIDEERDKLVHELAEKTQQAEVAEAEVVRKEQTLEEKLVCSICGEREKNRVFACGHPSCEECAVAWKRWFYNCSSERRAKPVKHHFPLYL